VKVTGVTDVDIQSIEYDSRQVKPHSLFVAIKGFKSDGYDYVKNARELGAAAVMGERSTCPEIATHIQVKNVRKALADVAARFFGYPGNKLTVFGVTGTNGKTTTCFLIKEILETSGIKAGLLTSTIYDTGKEVFKASRTTPESLDMQRLLFLADKNECDSAVVEVSSHGLVLHRVDNIVFKAAVYTNLTRDHLDFHKSMEEYLAAKAELLNRLDKDQAVAVINLDVPEFVGLLERDDIKFTTYSLSNREADVYCANYRILPNETVFDLVTPLGLRTIRIKLPGRFNLVNAIAAAAACYAAGIEYDDIVSGLEKAEQVPGRLNALDLGQPFGLYIDFAHTPDAIERVCESLRELSGGGKLLLVFGCGGDRDRGKRPLMGKAAIANADFVVVTADNPRSEEPNDIIEDIKPGLAGGNYEIEPDRKKAIELILERAKAGDVVLLAGKGAEKYQEVKGKFMPFDEVDIVMKKLAAMGYEKVKSVEEN
jgi:UDP-N-acetylmuramoyl-L-alanyl-D-glutamate--2,6-diaminopimelate ligase